MLVTKTAVDIQAPLFEATHNAIHICNTAKAKIANSKFTLYDKRKILPQKKVA
jgi:hypothetical protein